MTLAAHLWTVASCLKSTPEAPAAAAWSTVVEDPTVGPVTLTGRLRHEPECRTLLLFVHGIGGCADAAYARQLADSAARLGLSCLRFNLRGSDRRGGDYYHAGLSSDLGRALASPALAAYERVILLGYSLGGHVVLHYAASSQHGQAPDPRLAAVAAVCSPLDLTTTSRAIDAPTSWPYRRFVLRNLRQIYAAVAATRPVPVPVEETRRFTLLRQWDDAIVAPRWSFAGAEDYYARASVAPRLANLRVPALLVAAREDPMVPGEVLAPTAGRWSHVLDVRWVARGGHLSFPADLDLGVPGASLGLEGQALGWLMAHAWAS